MEITINLLCDIELNKIELFKTILSEHISFIGEESIASLKGIFITEDKNVASTVNTIIKSVEPAGNYSPREQSDSFAVTVPVEINGALNCFIVMGKKYFTDITPEFNHPFNTISMLLEELLHVKIYSLLWNKRGYIQYINKGFGTCKSDILSIASSLMDEYLVSRMKSKILSSCNSFQLESGKDLTGGKLSYGGNVFKRIKTAGIEFKQIVESLKKESVSIPEAWGHITRNLYRNIFEPLSRNAGFCDENQESCDDEQLKSIRMFIDLINDYWKDIHERLKTLYENNLNNYEYVKNDIANIIDSLLNGFGISYSRIHGEDCWVNIDPHTIDLFEGD